MKFLVVGVGGVGGYIGGWFVEKGNDVIFFVCYKRVEQLKEIGFVIYSEKGDVLFQFVLISVGEIGYFDVVIIVFKVYLFDQVIDDVKLFIGCEFVIIFFLNGYCYYEQLFMVFLKEQVLGGLCFIESVLNNKGEIYYMSVLYCFVFGEWNGECMEWIIVFEEVFLGVKVEVIISGYIEKDIWKKYLFIVV